MKRNKIIKIVLSILGLFLLIGLIGGFYWLNTYSAATSEALLALTTNEKVIYTESNLLSFEPTSTNSNTGIIFYPGGKVDPKAYAPFARDLALKGYSTVIVTMPFNLAVFNINGANQVIEKFPNIQNWILVGHSLGGSMGANYINTSKNPKIKGLVFLASYPGGTDNLSQLGIKVLSIVGSNDGVVNKATLESSKSLLPSDTNYLTIEGGNHSQFGYYGLQSGDNPASVSLEDQQTQTVNAIDEFIKNFNF